MWATFLLPSILGLFEAPCFRNSPVRLFPLLLALCFLLSLMGCSLPRIIILKDPLTAEEHLNLGVAYEKQGEFEPAIKEYKAAAKKLPRAYLYLGNV